MQATNDDPDGTEFMLVRNIRYNKPTFKLNWVLQVFDDGSFSEDNTFLLTDWTAHIPKEVLAKSFQLNISAFDHIPEKELYIFPAGLSHLRWSIIIRPASD